MKIRIIRIIILVVTLLSTIVAFRYLDKRCSSIGCSKANKDYIMNPLGVKVSLYTGCPSSIEFKDTKNNGISCYLSWIPNPNCDPQPLEGKMLLSFLIGDTHVLLCEKGSNGSICYNVLKRGEKSLFYEEIISEEDAGRMVTEGMSSKIIHTDANDVEELINAMDCCLYAIFFLILLLAIESFGIILAVRKCMKSE